MDFVNVANIRLDSLDHFWADDLLASSKEGTDVYYIKINLLLNCHLRLVLYVSEWVSERVRAWVRVCARP